MNCQSCQVGAVFIGAPGVFRLLKKKKKMTLGGIYVTENYTRSAHSQEQHFAAALDGSVQGQRALF